MPPAQTFLYHRSTIPGLNVRSGTLNSGKASRKSTGSSATAKTELSAAGETRRLRQIPAGSKAPGKQRRPRQESQDAIAKSRAKSVQTCALKSASYSSG